MNNNYNIINDNLIQIYGEVNGFAWRVEFEGRKVWRYQITFFQRSKRIKLSTAEKEGTIHNLDILKKRILKVIEEKY